MEYPQAWFNGSTTYDSLVSTWTSNWAYISLNGIAPVWVGEFGTLNDDADVQATAPGSQGQWFSSLVQFLTANPNMSWTYWALNGEDRYGLLDSAYDSTPVSALKQQLLAGIQFPLSGGTPITTPSFTLAQTSVDGHRRIQQYRPWQFRPDDGSDLHCTGQQSNQQRGDFCHRQRYSARRRGRHHRSQYRLSSYLQHCVGRLQLQLRQHCRGGQRGH